MEQETRYYYSLSIGFLMLRINLQTRDFISFLPTNKMSVKSKFIEENKILNFFDIHMSMHHKYMPKSQPTRSNASQFIYFCKRLCMFQAVPPPIIRSKKVYIQRQAFVKPLLLPASIVNEIELYGVPSHPRQKQVAVMV